MNYRQQPYENGPPHPSNVVHSPPSQRPYPSVTTGTIPYPAGSRPPPSLHPAMPPTDWRNAPPSGEAPANNGGGAPWRDVLSRYSLTDPQRDELQKQLASMDQVTAVNTIEMSRKMPDVLRAALDVHAADPSLPPALFKRRVLDRIGPLPVRDLGFPVDPMVVLYEKMYGHGPDMQVRAAIEALSRAFERQALPQLAPLQQPSRASQYAPMPPPPQQPLEVGVGDDALAGFSLSGDQRDEIKKQLATMDPQACKKTLEMSRKMSTLLRAAIDVYTKSSALSAQEFKRRVLIATGPLPMTEMDLPVEPMYMLYEKVFGHPPYAHDRAAIDLMVRAFAKPPPKLYPRASSPPADATVASKELLASFKLTEVQRKEMEKQLDVMDPKSRMQTVEMSLKMPAMLRAAVDIHRAHPSLPPSEFKRRVLRVAGPLPVSEMSFPEEPLRLLYKKVFHMETIPREGTAAMAAMARAFAPPPPRLHPNRAAWPASVEVACNGQGGIFFPATQTLNCYCDMCRFTAAQHGKTHLELSPGEFERHCGMGQSKKWRLTIRVRAPTDLTLGQWMDEHGVTATYTRQTADDLLLREAERERDRREGGRSNKRKSRTASAPPAAAAAAAAAAPPSQHGGGTGGGGFETGTDADDESAAAEKDPLRSPSGKRWMTSPSRRARRSSGGDENAGTRLGERYQAEIPPWRPAPSKSAGKVDPRGGEPGPDEVAALASAAGVEAANASVLPRDAVEDVWARGGGGVVRHRSAPKIVSVAGMADGGGGGNGDDGGNGGGAGRSQRQRKQPFWMRQTVDPNAVLGGRALLERSDNSDYENEEEGAAPAVVGGRFFRASGDGEHGNGMGEQARKRAKLEAEAVLEAQIDLALARAKTPSLQGWRVTDSNQLAVTIHLGDVTFSGVLPAINVRQGGASSAQLERRPAATSRAAATAAADRASRLDTPSDRRAAPSSAPAAAAAAAAAAVSLPTAAPPAARAGPALPSAGEGVTPVGGTSARGGKRDVKLSSEERHIMAAKEYERLLVSGPPEDATCAMCHGRGQEAVPREAKDASGKSEVGLGGLVLIRSSAITNCWVHDQCARWSPEVYDPTGEGILEGVKEAVRRGRMLRCKVCNEKGATLGCLKKTCRASYHLPCARISDCLLSAEPYAVACPQHVDQLPNGLSSKLGYTKRRAPKAVAPVPINQTEADEKTRAEVDVLGLLAAARIK